MESPFSRKPHLRPKSETALAEWVKATGESMFGLAKRLQRHPSQVRYWVDGQQLPSLIDAFLLERETAGAVPVASWLGTELAKFLVSQRGTDWTNLSALRKDEMRRNDKARKKRRER
jgi:hypothetical protein